MGMDIFFQAWSVFRQMVRFVLVTRSAVVVSSQLQRPLRIFVGFDCANPGYNDQIAMLKEQGSLTYNGFEIGPLFRLDSKTVSVLVLLMIGSLWIALQFKKQQILTQNSGFFIKPVPPSSGQEG